MKHSQSLQYQANKAGSDVQMSKDLSFLSPKFLSKKHETFGLSFLIEDKCTWQSVHLSLDPEQCIFAALHNMEKSNENTNRCMSFALKNLLLIIFF